MVCLIRAISVTLAFWAAMSLSVLAQTGAPSRSTDLRDIIRFANQITQRSGCFAAACVRMPCETAPETWHAMMTALWWSGEIDGTLVELRDMEMANAMAHLENSTRDQERVSYLRELQLIQDSVAVVYVAASEIASILDLKESLTKNADEWKKVFSGKSPLDKFAVLKDLKSMASRANSFSKYPDIGKDKKQNMPWGDMAKAAAEGQLRWAELLRKKADGSLTTEAKRKAWLSQLKDLGDIALKIDRMARQARIAEYQRDAMAALGVAQVAADEMAQINKARRLARDAQTAIERAAAAFMNCYSPACRAGATSAPQFDSFVPVPVDEKLKPTLRASEYDKRIRAARDAMAVAAQNHAPLIDANSRLSVENSNLRYDEDVVARHAIARFRIGREMKQCIPENAWLTVVKGKNKPHGPSIMDVAQANPSPGREAFKVQENLAGTWRSADGALEIEIGIVNDTVLITRPNTPVDGRDRIYQGTLVRQFSQPGDYTLVLRDDDGRSYLPVHFTVVGPDKLVENTVVAYSNPTEIADISPAVPEDIRQKLLGEEFREKIRYRAEMDVEINPGNATELHLKLFNHKLKFGSNSRKVVADSITDKLSTDTNLLRADDTRQAAETR